MNGLKWIMIHCNYEAGQLADDLEIEVEELMSWMEDIALLPEDMKERIAEYFGIEKKYFVNLSEQQKEELLRKPLFIHRVENGCEWYRFYPADNRWKTSAFYIADRAETYQAEYRRKLEDFHGRQKRFAEIFTDFSDDYLSEARISMASRGQKYLSGYSELFESVSQKKPGTQTAHYEVIDEVILALMEAVENPDDNENGAMPQWSAELSRLIKEHIKEKLKQPETVSPEKEEKNPEDMLLCGEIRSYNCHVGGDS